jgi:GNAT superfamily N-acetyltransferase
VRQADAADAPFLQRMIWEALLASPHLFQELGSEAIREHEERYWGNWTPDSAPAFVAHDGNGDAIGALVLYRNENGEGLSWRVGMAVAQGARGNGVGEELLRHALGYARDEGGREVNLFVDKENARAINLYRKVGFAELGDEGSTIEMKLALI